MFDTIKKVDLRKKVTNNIKIIYTVLNVYSLQVTIILKLNTK